MKWNHKNADDPAPDSSEDSERQSEESSQNLAAQMIRKKLESVEAINADLAPPPTQDTLGPKQHGSHVPSTESTEAPGVIDPTKIVKSTAPYGYHDSLYSSKSRSPFSKVTSISPPQVLHKSTEKLKKIKPPKSFVSKQPRPEEAGITEAVENEPQKQIQQPPTFPAQRTDTHPEPAAQINNETPHIAKYADRPRTQKAPQSAEQVQTTEATMTTPRIANRHQESKQAQQKDLPQPSKRSSTLTAKAPAMQAPRIGFKRPLMIAMIVGFAFMILNYNEIAVAQVKQYITPSSAISTPVITDPNAQVEVSGEARIIIPKVNVDVPVVYDITSFEEDAIQAGLERGVVHYGTTALPGQIGNNVIVGHSSNNFFNGGKYKFAFVLLDRLENGDTFALHYQGQRYVYEVFRKEVIAPTDFSVVQPSNEPITTLITCSPPGTSWNRLVIQARQILPDPGSAQLEQGPEQLPDIQGPVPGNPESFWSRIF